jgi:RNA ligase (TIGR02306 family)
MAIWKVVADKIQLFPHPNADKMLLGKVGGFQVVVAKSNNYQDGDVVIFAPEKSVLPEDLRPHYTNSETGQSYLSGSNHDRVSRVRLRGEYSEGVTISMDYVRDKIGGEIPLGVDLSEKLGITKYEPPIPTQFAGQMARINTVADFRQHDVEQFRLYANEFKEGELVLATEKLHGSQINILRDADGQCLVTSKGMAGRDVSILEDAGNIYWRAVRNIQVFEKLGALLPDSNVQLFGEVIPCQGGYSYGQTVPTVKFFRMILDGKEFSVNDLMENKAGDWLIKEFILENWVPVIYEGPYDVDKLVDASKGMEQVSGKQLHIREGVVVSPVVPRLSSEGFPLFLKIINPKYRDTGEEIS